MEHEGGLGSSHRAGTYQRLILDFYAIILTFEIPQLVFFNPKQNISQILKLFLSFMLCYLVFSADATIFFFKSNFWGIENIKKNGLEK